MPAATHRWPAQPVHRRRHPGFPGLDRATHRPWFRRPSRSSSRLEVHPADRPLAAGDPDHRGRQDASCGSQRTGRSWPAAGQVTIFGNRIRTNGRPARAEPAPISSTRCSSIPYLWKLQVKQAVGAKARQSGAAIGSGGQSQPGASTEGRRSVDRLGRHRHQPRRVQARDHRADPLGDSHHHRGAHQKPVIMRRGRARQQAPFLGGSRRPAAGYLLGVALTRQHHGVRRQRRTAQAAEILSGAGRRPTRLPLIGQHPGQLRRWPPKGIHHVAIGQRMLVGTQGTDQWTSAGKARRHGAKRVQLGADITRSTASASGAGDLLSTRWPATRSVAADHRRWPRRRQA